MRKLLVAAVILMGVGLVLLFIGSKEGSEASSLTGPEQAAEPSSSPASVVGAVKGVQPVRSAGTERTLSLIRAP